MERFRSELTKVTFISLFFLISLGVSHQVNAFSILHEEVYEKENLSGVYELGAFISLKRDLNLRKSPRGKKLQILLKGDRAQIISVRLSSESHRYYQVFFKGKTGRGKVGFIYGGQNHNYYNWVEQAWDTEGLKKFLASPGDAIRVKNIHGLSIRYRPGQRKVSLLPHGSRVIVESITQDEQGKVYYKIKHRSYKGYVYAGNLEKQKTLFFWTEVI